LKKLLIFPFNGNGIEALGCVNEGYDFIGFIDDTKEKQGRNSLGFEVYSRDALDKFPDAKVLAVPGSPQSYTQRRDVIDSLKINDKRYANVIHPNAIISSFAKIGFNVLVMGGVIVTSNSDIGNHICILPNCVLHHDTIIGDYTLIGSNVNIAGNTSIGQNCYIGSGSNIINNIEIGEKALVGLGTNVINSVKKNSRVVGNPGKYI
jgi:sugar O-acyltransferase (sialic acid O-acetyltransferase NeuD family)